jgi:transcriptional regulator with XRE-family HTH domain
MAGKEEHEMARSDVDPRLFAARLREVVADEPKAFAYDVGVSLSALYNYLNGRIPSTPVLFRIARYTGRPMEWFLGGEEDLSAVACRHQSARSETLSAARM